MTERFAGKPSLLDFDAAPHQRLALSFISNTELPIEEQRCQSVHLRPGRNRQLARLTRDDSACALPVFDDAHQAAEGLLPSREQVWVRRLRRRTAAKHHVKVLRPTKREANIGPTRVGELASGFVRVLGRGGIELGCQQLQALLGDCR
jgi:hypothetical protein